MQSVRMQELPTGGLARRAGCAKSDREAAEQHGNCRLQISNQRMRACELCKPADKL